MADTEAAELATLVRELVDREAIRELAVRYAAAVDGRDIDGLCDLFVDDAEVDRWGTGSDALRRMFDDVLRSFTTSIHWVGNHLIDLDGDRATGQVYCRVEEERDGAWVVLALVYRDGYERRGRRWRFVSRDVDYWYATEHLDPPAGPNKVRLPGQPATAAALPSSLWPSWEQFWGHAGTEPVPAHTVRLAASGGLHLTADVRGNEGDPVVVLLHGGGQTRHSWGTTASTLARHGWRTVAVDARGHGDSDWSPDGHYGFERFADDVVQLARQFDRPALVGASLGGVSAMLAILRSETPLASALVLVDVAHRLNVEGTSRIGAFMRGSPEGFESLEEAADAVAEYIPHRPRPRNLKGLEKNLRQRDDGRWVWHWDPRFLRLEDAQPGLFFPTPELIEATGKINDLQLPTMLVRGRLSDVVAEEHAQELQELIPHARVIDVAGAGHMVAGDSNDLFNEAIVEFLDEAVRPSLRT